MTLLEALDQQGVNPLLVEMIFRDDERIDITYPITKSYVGLWDIKMSKWVKTNDDSRRNDNL